MSSFTIEVPKTPQEAERTRVRVQKDSQEFPWNWMNADRFTPRIIDQKLSTLFQNLQRGHHWTAFAMIDGPAQPIELLWEPRQNKPSIEEQRQQARTWATETFEHRELQNLLDICVGTALTAGTERMANPGTNLGHLVLYQHLVEKGDSMFAEAVTEPFRKRLNNGRFWETLPDMNNGVNLGYSYKVAEEFLMSSDPDLEFVPEGFRAFSRNDQDKNCFDLYHLSTKAIDSYADFIAQIDQHQSEFGLEFKDVARIVRPYVEVIMARKSDYDNSGGPLYPLNSKRNYRRRLQEPLVSKYLSGSELVREAAADKLHLLTDYGDPNFAGDILSNIPNAGDIQMRIFRKEHPSKVKV